MNRGRVGGLLVMLVLCVAPFGATKATGAINPASQAILADPSTGLVAGDLAQYDYTHAERNTLAIQNALAALANGQTLLLPSGVYDVETVLVPTSLSNIELAGQGLDQTTLRRKGFSWDNNTQGDCALRTEIVMVQSDNVTLRDLTLDGNGHHMQISGYGEWNTSTGETLSGLPQFATFISNDAYAISGGCIMNARLCDDLTIHNVRFTNGYRWALSLGKLDGLTFTENIIDTGNLSTEYRGHYDPAPNNTVMHMHTSQDGLHMTNVSNAVIEYNDIHSEDSAIAVELNPAWDWGGYDQVANVKIGYNSISTNSPTDPAKLLNDDDVIYGTGLADRWVGNGAIDIFYNEWFDVDFEQSFGGASGPFRGIEIYGNALEDARHAVRCGVFMGAGPYANDCYLHRVYDLTVRDHVPTIMAGRERNRPAGIRRIVTNDIEGGYNHYGGIGILLRNLDKAVVQNNLIEEISGGTGIELVRVTDFSILSNTIDNVSGDTIGSEWALWSGGEGIRVWNDTGLTEDPNLQGGFYDGGNFLILGNKIGRCETHKIGIFYTMNGTVRQDENYDLYGNPLCGRGDGIALEGTQNIDIGACETDPAAEGQAVFSDTFDSTAAWDSLGGAALNNALGGAASVHYIAWGGNWANPDFNYDATGQNGNRAAVVSWSGVAAVQGFDLDPLKGYVLECSIHPPAALSGAGENLYGGVRLWGNVTSDLSDTAGVNLYVRGTGLAGTDGAGALAPGPQPDVISLAYLSTSGAVSREVCAISKYDYYSDFWIELAVDFAGLGTEQSPMTLKIYVNGNLLTSQTITDLVQAGGRAVGYLAQREDQDSLFDAWPLYDNLKLSQYTAQTAASLSMLTFE